MAISYDQIKMDDSWKELLKDEFEQPYFSSIKEKLIEYKNKGKTIYPKGNYIFHAFNLTPVDKVKAVILGQDPYHQPGQAMGLAFSVPRDCKIPPSLRTIYTEMKADVALPPPKHGDLSNWAKEGVLLLNAMLTVEKGKAGSHRKLGWQEFTDAVITKLSSTRQNIVFMLWGNFAKNKRPLILQNDHLILEAAHPSPLARGAYYGSKHFSKCNQFLTEKGIRPINWHSINI